MSRWSSSSSFSSPALPQSHYQQHQSVFDLFPRELHFNDLGQKNYYYLCQEVNPKWPSLDLQGCTLDYLGATNVFVRENVRRNTNIHIYILELMISSSRGAALSNNVQKWKLFYVDIKKNTKEVVCTFEILVLYR